MSNGVFLTRWVVLCLIRQFTLYLEKSGNLFRRVPKKRNTGKGFGINVLGEVVNKPCS